MVQKSLSMKTLKLYNNKRTTSEYSKSLLLLTQMVIYGGIKLEGIVKEMMSKVYFYNDYSKLTERN